MTVLEQREIGRRRGTVCDRSPLHSIVRARRALWPDLAELSLCKPPRGAARDPATMRVSSQLTRFIRAPLTGFDAAGRTGYGQSRFACSSFEARFVHIHAHVTTGAGLGYPKFLPLRKEDTLQPRIA